MPRADTLSPPAAALPPHNPPRDAAVGFARANPVDTDSQRRRTRRNLRDRTRRAQAKARGEMPNRTGVAALRVVLATCADPGTYKLADRLPAGPGPGKPGCPRDYPNWMFVVIGAGVRAYGSAKAALDNFREPAVWNAILDEVRHHRGDHIVDDMRRKEPPQPHHWDYMLRLISKQPATLDDLQEQFRRIAVSTAQRQGRLLDQTGFQLQTPNTDNYLYADGGVFGSPSRTLVPTTEDPDTGEVLVRRYDESRGLWYQGGITDRATHGSKMNIVINRGQNPNTRIIMSVDHQPEGHPGGEGAMLVTMAKALKKVAPGITGLLTDGILRHVHVQELAECGLIGVAPFAAHRRFKQFTDRKYHLPPPVEHFDHTHQLAYSDGAIGIYAKQNRSDKKFTVLEPTRHAQTREDGSLYITKVVTIPCPSHGDFQHRVLISGPNLKKDGFKRNEYLRVYGEQEKAWDAVYSRRVDAEATIRTIKRNLQDDRLPAYGPVRQTFLMLLMSHAHNCVSAYLHDNAEHKRSGPPAPGQSAFHPDAYAPRTPPPPQAACCCDHRPRPQPCCLPCDRNQHAACEDPLYDS